MYKIEGRLKCAVSMHINGQTSHLEKCSVYNDDDRKHVNHLIWSCFSHVSVYVGAFNTSLSRVMFTLFNALTHTYTNSWHEAISLIPLSKFQRKWILKHGGHYLETKSIIYAKNTAHWILGCLNIERNANERPKNNDSDWKINILFFNHKIDVIRGLSHKSWQQFFPSVTRENTENLSYTFGNI